MAPRKSPKDAICPHCKRSFTKGGLKQHLRYVKCSPNSTATPRKFERVRCKHCLKSFHSTNSLRVHVSTVHAKEYSKSPGHMKHHRAPYHGKKRSGTDASGNKSHRRSPAHASTHLAERAPSSWAGIDGQARSNHGSKRPLSDGERRGHPHHTEKGARHVGNARGPLRSAAEPIWQRELSKQIAAAASRT